MIAFFPAEAPRYTVLTTIETRAQAGKAYYGGPLAGPVVKRMVDYIYNRGHDWYGRVDGSGRSAALSGAAQGGRHRPDPPCRGGSRPAWSMTGARGGARRGGQPLPNVVITSLPGDRGVMPDVRGMGLKDALFLLESRGLKVPSRGGEAVTRQTIHRPERALRRVRR